MYNNYKINYLTFLIFLCFLFILSGCAKNNKDSNDIESYGFQLVDSVRIKIPVEPHFVELKKKNDRVLLYSWINSTFYVINSQGEIILELNRIGEAPGYYNKSVYQAGIIDERLVIQDPKKLSSYNLKGEFMHDLAYENRFIYSTGGNIQNGLLFFHDSLIVNRLGFTGPVSSSNDKLAVLDTIKIIEFISRKNGRVLESPQAILFESESLYKKDLVYPSFLPIFDVNDNGGLIVAYPYEQSLYEYDFQNDQLELINRIDFELDQFKLPRGVENSALIQRVDPTMNKYAGLNSSILKIFSFSNDSVFIIYSTGVPDRYESEVNLGPFYKEKKLLGGIIKNGNLVASGIEIPNNGFEYMNQYQLLHWGDNQWAFIQENQEEQDFYRLYIYELKSN